MHKIDTLNAVLGAPAPKTPGTPGWFDQGDPEVPRDATHLDQDWCNAVQGELTAPVEAAGLALDKTNRAQLLTALPILVRDKLHGFRADPQSPASLSVDVGPGTFYDGPTGALVAQGTQTPAAFVAPGANPRKDIIHIDARTGAVGVTAGTEAASPVDPVIAFDELPVARINLTVGMTEISAAEIDDIRYLNALGTGVRRDFQIFGPTALSGSAVGFTGIRSGARRVTFIVDEASFTGADNLAIQIGPNTGYATSGYSGNVKPDGVGGTNWTAGYAQITSGAANTALATASISLVHMVSDTWNIQSISTFGQPNLPLCVSGGVITLSGALDRVQLIATGADTYDNGSGMMLVE